MNVNIKNLISLYNERKKFFNNHPDAYRFMLDEFGQKLPVGTEMEISVKKLSGQTKKIVIKIDEIDKGFIDNISEILKKD